MNQETVAGQGRRWRGAPAWRARMLACGWMALALVPCARAGDEAPRFGIADLQPMPLACVTFAEPALAPGQAVSVLSFDPPRWWPGRIVEKRRQPCRLTVLPQDSVHSVYSAYELRLDAAPEALPADLSLAVVAPGRVPDVEGKAGVLRGAGEAQPALRLERCAGSEGLHFTVLRDGTPFWHEYVYLGYDIEPSCR